MKVGAEPKKVAILSTLVVAAGYVLYTNAFSGQPSPPAPARSAAGTPPEPALAALPEVGRPVPRPERRASSRTGLQEFRPSLRPRRPGERRDLSSIDPTLRLDLLAKLQEVPLEGGARSLFDFAAAPLPKTPEAKIIPKPFVGPLPPPTADDSKPETASKPPPPPIPLKFFGYTTQVRQGVKRAFFLDGDEIHVASEGDVVKKRYRVVRVGVNSVVMEDMEFKREQTLPLEAQAS